MGKVVRFQSSNSLLTPAGSSAVVRLNDSISDALENALNDGLPYAVILGQLRLAEGAIFAELNDEDES